MSSAEERFDLKARLLSAFERGDLAFSLPSDDPVVFAETAQEICRERGVSLDSHIDYKVGRVTLRANRGMPLGYVAFSAESKEWVQANAPFYNANKELWRETVGIDRGC